MIDHLPNSEHLFKTIQLLSNRFNEYENENLNESNTENFFIRPLFSDLGYDPSNTDRFSSQYPANPRDIKSGKVDIALKRRGHPIMFIEVKKLHESLDNNSYIHQITQYFNLVQEIKILILTNGNEYRFYTDLERENLLDHEPFFVFKLNDVDQESVEFLLCLSYQNFDSSKLKELARQKVRRDKIYHYLKKQFSSPTNEFISYLSKAIFGSSKIDVKKDVKRFLPDVFSKLIKGEMSDHLNPPNWKDPKDDNKDKTKINEEQNLFKIDKVTGTRIVYFRFQGEKIHGTTWADMYVHVLDKLCQRDVSKLSDISEKHKGFKITKESSIFEQWRRVKKIHHDYYISTCNSSEKKFEYLKDILESFDMKDSLFVKLENKEVKT